MAEFVMPSLGADMEAGTLVGWCKQPGDTLHRGDVIAEVETDKGVIDVDVFADGVLDKIMVNVGQKVPVGTVLATIREKTDSVDTDQRAPASIALSEVPRAKSQESAPSFISSIAAAPAHGRIIRRQQVSPAARRLARELGVNTEALTGTGRHGAITREDIQRAAGAKPTSALSPVALPGTIDVAPEALPSTSNQERAARMRQVIATRMARSKREIPHYYLRHTIDMQPAMNWLADENSRRPMTERLLYSVLLLKAVALALRKFPDLNAVWDGEKAVPQDNVHLGLVISLRDGGVVVPAIHDTDKQNLGELMSAFRDVVNRARSGRLRSSELSDSTVTVTNLGEQGVEEVFGVIFPPQVALIGFGKLLERPWVMDGGIFVRQTIIATLSADHRVSDGHRGGLFLSELERLLKEPNGL